MVPGLATVVKMPQQPTHAQWEQHRGLITDLYVNRGMKQKEIAQYMLQEHDFYATEKMLISRFMKWGINKKMSVEDAQAIIRAVGRRNVVGLKVSEVRLRGRKVTLHEAETSLKRRKRKPASPGPAAIATPSTPPTISVICEGEGDDSSRAIGLNDERYGDVLADHAVTRRPRTPSLVGQERYEVFFIYKMRDWFSNDRVSRVLSYEFTGIGEFFQDLNGLLSVQSISRNERAQWMIRQLGPITEQVLDTDDVRLMADFINAWDICEDSQVHHQELIRSIKSTILRAVEKAVSTKAGHPLSILCSFLFGHTEDGREKLFTRILRHCSVLSQERFGRDSYVYSTIEGARMGESCRRGKWREAEYILHGLIDFWLGGSPEQQVLAHFYKNFLAFLYLSQGRPEQAEAACIETIEYCREVSRGRNVPIARMPLPLSGAYEYAVALAYDLSCRMGR